VGGDLLAEARVLRAGKTRITGDVRLWIDGAPDRLVAHAVGSYARSG
jgi:acyl-coenzyme A thioesterase PaaI-like protein